MLRRLRSLVIPIAAVATVVACGVAGYIVGSRTSQNCTAALQVRDAMVQILIRGQTAVANTPAETLREKQRKQAIAFYDRSIADMNAVHCSS